MVGYGFGVIVGSGAFDFTVCFGIMSLFSFYHHKKSIKLKLRALLRDIYIYLLTLIYLVLVFWDYQVFFLIIYNLYYHKDIPYRSIHINALLSSLFNI
jgi:Ca2+/Na+ antiporter